MKTFCTSPQKDPENIVFHSFLQLHFKPSTWEAGLTRVKVKRKCLRSELRDVKCQRTQRLGMILTNQQTTGAASWGFVFDPGVSPPLPSDSGFTVAPKSQREANSQHQRILTFPTISSSLHIFAKAWSFTARCFTCLLARWHLNKPVCF